MPLLIGIVLVLCNFDIYLFRFPFHISFKCCCVSKLGYSNLAVVLPCFQVNDMRTIA